MRTLLVSITAIFLVLIGSLAAARAAEQHTFVISSNADGYGVDRCLSTGAKCGKLVAAAYCHAREYAQAASFRKVDRGDVTGAIPARSNGCRGNQCDLIAIVCSR
ncbi:MAG TPA: hypothetical protein VFL51_02125 [Pseudolabrys sp.]|nr:hypothetical protein [Pseudolabrys sp.]